MTYRGHVKNGVVVLDDPVALPEGCEVAVVVTSASEEPAENGEPTLFDQLAAVIGKGRDLPSDLAANHDHYLHGLPKK
jgi:hypothetical protein